MKSIIHKITDEMMQALGPIFHLYKDWEDIRVATCLIMARVIQASPHKGLEQAILAQSKEDISHALEQFLKLEEEAVKAKEAERGRIRATVEGGIEGFGALAPANGSEPGPALVGESLIIDADHPHTQGGFTEAEHLEFCQELHPSQEDIHDVQSAIEEAEMESGAEATETSQGEIEDDGYNPDGPRAYAP